MKILPIFLFAMFLSGCGNSQQKNTAKKASDTITYQLVKNWPLLQDGYVLGNPAGIGVDTAQNIFIFHRAGRKWPLFRPMPKSFIKSNTIILLYRQTGKIIDSWGANLFIMPHGLTVDAADNIWVTDVGLHQVFKFTHDGRLLLKLGEANVAGNDTAHFNRPTDVAVAPDGSFYVSDGYGNSRVMKFSAAGRFLFQWGSKGTTQGAFNIPHSIDLDAAGNVYVADRENKRIQKFDSAGKFLKQWTNDYFGKLYAVAVDKIKNELVTVDYISNYITIKGSNVICFDSTGNITSRFGRNGLYDGPFCRYHDVAVDNEGSIYVGDILGNRIQKFKKISH